MNWKSIGLHVVLVIIAWVLGSAIFGFIPIIMANSSYQHTETLRNSMTGYEAFGVCGRFQLI